MISRNDHTPRSAKFPSLTLPRWDTMMILSFRLSILEDQEFHLSLPITDFHLASVSTFQSRASRPPSAKGSLGGTLIPTTSQGRDSTILRISHILSIRYLFCHVRKLLKAKNNDQMGECQVKNRFLNPEA
jgi:hypothetical protein